MKKLKAPEHHSLMAPYLKNKMIRKKIAEGVIRLKVISQIIELREKTGMTQSELANRLGVSQPFIARIENDEAANLSLQTLTKIIDALGGEIEINIRPAKAA
jgi:DNA-binding XRE family transcriptional regulator